MHGFVACALLFDHCVRALAIALLLVPSLVRADDCDPIAIWRDGQRAGTVCRADAAARGLTVVDLRDDWVPSILATSAYRSTYAALAQERFGDAGLDGELAARDHYLELYGIEPTLTVVHARLADKARHRCHRRIDDTALGNAPLRIMEDTVRTARARLADGTDPEHVAVVRTVQAHLRCDSLFAEPPLDGGYTAPTRAAVQTFQRGVMLMPSGVLEGYTLAAFAQGSRERDYVTALRVLRARVVAATGLVEDGSAGPGQLRVLGRILDPEPTWRPRGYAPLDDGAPDLISAATEAAARALGWRDPASTLAFLDRVADRVVAVPLPELPAYHGREMDLSVEIDRGDIWRARDADISLGRRPALIVYARDGEHRIALARYPTTIGGWQDQQRGDGIVETWKESPVGRVVWRELYVVPRWLPPASTPDRELVRLDGPRYVLAREQLGPSYRAAFGLVAFVHDGGRDDGIRTHGTGSAASLVRGDSHGCHRLLGAHALRLATFILEHHDHVARGEDRTSYHRVVDYGGTFPVTIDSLGERIELDPPIPVDVLPGDDHP